MYSNLNSEPPPKSLEADRKTVYRPPVPYVCVGFCSVDVSPSPKSQNQLVTEAEDRSVKSTCSGARPELGDAPKSTSGRRPKANCCEAGGGGGAETMM